MLGVGGLARMTGGDVWSLAWCPPPTPGVGTTSLGGRVKGERGAYSSIRYPPRGTSTDQAKEMKYRRYALAGNGVIS